MIARISLFFVLFNLMRISVFSQNLLSPEVVATSGGFSVSSSLQVSWTLGELATESFFTPTISLTQGFQQHSYSIEMENSINETEIYSDLKIYPNPFQYFFNIDINIKENANISIELYTLEGRKLIIQKLKTGVNVVVVPNSISEILILKIINKTEILYTLKLIKN